MAEDWGSGGNSVGTVAKFIGDDDDDDDDDDRNHCSDMRFKAIWCHPNKFDP